MGYYGMSLNLAMTIGPALGVTLIGYIGYDSLFWLCAALGLGSLVLAQLIREPAHAPAPRQAGAQPHKWVSRAALFPGFIAVCMTVTFGAVVSFLPLFVRPLTLGNPGIYFSVYSIVVVGLTPLCRAVRPLWPRGGNYSRYGLSYCRNDHARVFGLPFRPPDCSRPARIGVRRGATLYHGPGG